MKRMKPSKMKPEKYQEKKWSPPNFKLSDIWLKKIKKGLVKIKKS